MSYFVRGDAEKGIEPTASAANKLKYVSLNLQNNFM